jgi:glycosyltransferase involved in cell wall biosynthesis
MKQEQVTGAGATSPPFLSVVTRCYKRPSFLEKNQASLEMQTMTNYEQILIIDEEGRGLHAANMSLADAYPSGEYVLVLDDDDVLVDPAALEMLQCFVEQEQRPGLIFFKADHGPLGTLPDSIVWGKRPIHGRVGSCDFISRRDIWEKHIPAFGAPSGGDYAYLFSVWQDGPCVAWLDKKLAAVQRISNGRAE